jgi:hypothetical protein
MTVAEKPTRAVASSPGQHMIGDRELSGLGEGLGVEALNTFTHLKTRCINFGGSKIGWAQAWATKR